MATDPCEDLSPCLPYLTGRAPVSAACASGPKTVVSPASTPADRRTLCGCLKSAASTISADPKRWAALPRIAGVRSTMPGHGLLEPPHLPLTPRGAPRFPLYRRAPTFPVVVRTRGRSVNPLGLSVSDSTIFSSYPGSISKS